MPEESFPRISKQPIENMKVQPNLHLESLSKFQRKILMKLVSYGNWPKKQQMAMNFMQNKFIILLKTKVKY